MLSCCPGHPRFKCEETKGHGAAFPHLPGRSGQPLAFQGSSSLCRPATAHGWPGPCPLTQPWGLVDETVWGQELEIGFGGATLAVVHALG